MHNNSGGCSIYKIMALYIGSIIGAGFASGQEILQFFVLFGNDGFLGILLATFLFGLLGGLVMLLAVGINAANYTEVYDIALGKIPGRVMDFLSIIMLPGGLVVMLAGGSAVFSEHLGLPGWLGTLLIAIITVAVLSRGLQGVIAANAVLVPVKVSAILLICLFALIYSGGPSNFTFRSPLNHGSGFRWAWSAILYVSYNMVVPVAILSSLGKTVSEREGVAGGILGGVVLGVATGLVFFAGLCFYPGIAVYEVPLLYIAGKLGTAVKLALGALIWLAILTTAIADAHGFASRFAEPHSRKYRVVGTGSVLLALPLSAFKFSFLVKVLYPLFGYVGLILLFSLLFVLPFKLIKKDIFQNSLIIRK